ncbi:MAG: DNA polymerase III subunit delta [Alphaproteobacteria bacterium]|nr:DNA polymerase III subunit delta [Alphaproteobacteria bacterium]
MKIGSVAADGFTRAPTKSVVLVYGPDQGLVRERGRALAGAVLGNDIGDPFRTAELAGTTVGGDTAALVDEAAALSLIGGRRVVRVVGATDGLAEAFASVLKARAGRDPVSESLVVAEAGELGPRSPLRRLFEDSPDAAAVACYADEGYGLVTFAEGLLEARGHTVEAAALDWIARALGGDRAVVRSELEKLSLYVGPGARITAADVEACLGDSADIDADEAALAVATGDLAGLDRAIARSYAGGQSPVSLLRTIGRELARIHQVAGAIAGGVAERAAFAQLRPPVFFKNEPAYRRALQAWRVENLARALEMLAEAEVQCKTAGAPDESIAWRTALRIANAARRSAA